MTVPALFYGSFKLSATGLGATGLTVTVDVDRITKADGTKSNLVTAGAATTECRNGVYAYLLSGADFLLYDYITIFKTVATTVVSKEAEAWRGGLAESMQESYTADRAAKLDNADVAVSSRLSTVGYTAPNNADIIVAAAASVSAASGVATLLARITSTLFTGITALGGWLRILARKDAAAAADYAESLAEINVDGGTGAGGFTNLSESLEAIAETSAAGTSLVINATAPELQTIAADGSLNIHRGDYTEFELTLGDLTGRSGEKLVCTLKPTKTDLDDDSEAYLQVTELSGVVLLNGSSDGVVAADGSMTVLNVLTGQTRFIFKSDLTDQLPFGSNFWFDVQEFDADGERHTKYECRAAVARDVTRRSS